MTTTDGFPDLLFGGNGGATGEEFPTAMAARVGSRFALPAPLEAYDFAEKGNINRDTFLLICGPGDAGAEYLLQRINHEVFTRPQHVMSAMLASLEAQRRSLARGLLPAGREWEPITLIPTRDGASYLEASDRRGTTHWRLMVRITDCRSYKSLGEVPGRDEQLRLAEEVGRGLALYGDFTADMDASALISPLPGYRDTQVYYDQWTSVLAGNRTLDAAQDLLPDDDAVRETTEQHFLVQVPADEHRRRMEAPEVRRFIDLVEREREFALTLQRHMETGAIRTVGIHGDTKLENFLFSSRTGLVKALVDLDTIMPHTWLSDWGDMVRSLTNVAGEKERDLAKVRVDMEIYAAVVRGFLGTAREVTPEEIALMVDAVRIIALELGMRFLTDYLRGDNYFTLSSIDPPDLNKVRGLAQLTLFERLTECAAEGQRCIDSVLSER